jgi:hypothetical protein
LGLAIWAYTRLELFKRNAAGIKDNEGVPNIIHDLLKFQHRSSIRLRYENGCL